MTRELILDLLRTYVSENAYVFSLVGITPSDACTRLMWDVPIDPDMIDMPSLIQQVCASA